MYETGQLQGDDIERYANNGVRYVIHAGKYPYDRTIHFCFGDRAEADAQAAALQMTEEQTWVRWTVVEMPQERRGTEMTQAQAEYYVMSDERAAAIAVCDPRLTADDVREFALADWAEGDEHQAWLDTAPAQEIASWVLARWE